MALGLLNFGLLVLSHTYSYQYISMGLSKIVVAVLCTIILVHSEVLVFDNSAIDKIFQQKNAALFLFTSSNDESKAAKAALQELDEAGTTVILTNSDADDGHGLFQRLGEYLGVSLETTPQVLYLGEKTDKYQFNGQEITKETLTEFITKVKAGEIEQYLKSAPIPENNNDPVKIGVGKNFKEMVLDSDKEYLVKFYAPWCGHCKTLAPHYDEAAKKLESNPNIFLVKVDSTENEVAGVEIQGFPTLKFWGKDKSRGPIDYNGERTAEGILKWLKEHTEYDWVEVTETVETVEDL